MVLCCLGDCGLLGVLVVAVCFVVFGSGVSAVVADDFRGLGVL